MLREYITLGGATIAIIDAGGINYVHNDHLATPQVMTDGAAAVVWDASYRPFGEATIAGAAANQQRFPGQTADAETGYSDNWYRTYDASLGRYLQSDPIGLMAGFNTYAYAGGNPVMNMDPTGQFIMFVPLFWAVVEAVVIGVTIYEVVNIAKRVTERYRNGCRGWDLITRWEITEIVLMGKLKWLKFLWRPLKGGKGAPGFAMSGGGGVPGVPTRPRGPSRPGGVGPDDVGPDVSGTTRNGIKRTNPADWRKLRDRWDDGGYGDILSEDNRGRIAKGKTPIVDDAWVEHFPGDAGLMGEKINMHHIGGNGITVPLPHSRHRDAHMPGGYKNNPGGPGMSG